MKRKFYKSHTRAMALLCCQYWYNGERYGIYEATEQAGFYEPLFVYNQGLTYIYYEDPTAAQAESKMVKYFQNKPNRLSEITTAFDDNFKDSDERGQIKASFEYLNQLWPLVSLTYVLGKYQTELGSLAEQALSLRQHYSNLEYNASGKLYNLVKQKLAQNSNQANYLTISEVTSGRFLPSEEFTKRKTDFVYYQGQLFSGLTVKEFSQKNDLLIVEEKARLVNHFKGQVAYRGRVTGTTKLVFKANDFNKIEAGDILVTSMTTPDFLPAMKKAAAFITDEGGITCHAAIISREMKKPCVIGSKVATQVLKDGDEVEVDAERGIVKIIKKQS